MLRIIFALLLAEFGACAIFSAQAQTPIYFPAEDFGDVNKSFEESSQNQETLEILMGNADVFEDVVMLAADDPNRLIGRSVAMLDLLVQLPDGRKYNPTCTATRISADYLITNFHCVPGKSFTVLSVKARFGYLDRDNATGTLYGVERTVVEADPVLDYAILRFSEHPPVELYPPLAFSTRDAGARESLFLLHHPAGFPQKLTRIRCQAGSPPVDARNRLVHHCDTLGGSSGTAILALKDRAFAALHHSGVPDPVRPRNLGTPVSRLVSDSAVLRRIISEGEVASSAGRSVGSQPAPATSSSYRAGETFRDTLVRGGTGPEMTVLPSGSFMMGSPASETGRDDDEGKQRRVTIDYKFAVGTYEVSWDEWEACVSAGDCDGSGPQGAGDDEGWGKGSRPVINVSWEDARAYATWLSGETGATYRLLSESEWEYAARAGSTGPYPWGPSIGRNKANCGGGECGDQYDKTAPAGSFPVNSFGLHDMHGNVWEWVEDWYKSGYSHALSDGASFTNCSDCSNRVFRGGSWYGSPQYLRSANRFRDAPGNRSNLIGFRVARTLPD